MTPIDQSHKIGEFNVEWRTHLAAREGLVTKPLRTEKPHFQQLLIHWKGRVVWASCPTGPLLRAGKGSAVFHESRGFFQIDEEPTEWSECCTVSTIVEKEGAIWIQGHFDEQRNYWSMRLTAIDSNRLDIRVSIKSGNRLELRMNANPEERIFGFGQQLTHLNIKGRRIPVLSQEPGIGRGVQPLTWIMNTFFKAGGEWHNTNAPAAWFLSSENVGFGHSNTEYSIFDFREPGYTTCQLYGSSLNAVLVAGNSPASILESYTLNCGRMPALPDWIHQGAIVGMQGGSEAVRRLWSKLKDENAAISAFWLQDWVGARTTSIGKQLWWNWELDHDRYPNWDSLRLELENNNISVMTYINPFLVDASEKGNVNRNLYLEAQEKGYLVQNLDGQEYAVLNTSFSAALVDLSNPEAYDWLKNVIKDQLIGTGARGWMADFGEALPYDIKLHSDESPEVWHNRYPMEWMKLNREAIKEAGREGDVVFFNRAGFTHSPKYSTLFWMGDQLTHWRKEDGMHSALIGLLSSGFSGITLNHGDIGGYTATTFPKFPVTVPGIGFARDKELLLRWIEFNAFTPIFRTHEGNQPTKHVQIDHDAETLAHFSRFSRVYAALSDYRRKLFEEAENSGQPVVRSLWFVFPDDPQTLDIDDQFCLGNDVLVAPILTPATTVREFYLPEGRWIDFWDQTPFDSSGQFRSQKAPIGRPIVWVRSDSVDKVIPAGTERLS